MFVVALEGRKVGSRWERGFWRWNFLTSLLEKAELKYYKSNCFCRCCGEDQKSLPSPSFSHLFNKLKGRFLKVSSYMTETEVSRLPLMTAPGRLGVTRFTLHRELYTKNELTVSFAWLVKNFSKEELRFAPRRYRMGRVKNVGGTPCVAVYFCVIVFESALMWSLNLPTYRNWLYTPIHVLKQAVFTPRILSILSPILVHRNMNRRKDFFMPVSLTNQASHPWT